MRSITKIVCGSAMLACVMGANAAGISISQTAGSVVLQSGSGQAASASAPVAASTRVMVMPYYSPVDRAQIEKRLEDRGIRTKKRALDAEKAAAGRAAQAGQP